MRRVAAALLLGAVPLLISLLPAAPARPAVHASAPVVARPAAEPAGTPAADTETPVYRDPRSYEGPRRAPKVKPLVGRPRALSATGEHPDVYVDEAGTAHIVWNEGRGDAADATMYCRLERAASGCDTTATLEWNKTYDTGDGPQYNIDNDGPKIVRIGDTLLALSFRSPTISQKPDGASGSTLVGWTSFDGGDTWDPAEILGKRRLEELVVVGPDDDPVILNLAHDAFCDSNVPAGYMLRHMFPAGTLLSQ
ncbi:MAG TPA: hypothetical protein VNU26_11435, partial [Mycobacteriales bacterium]|nr:hypothetical protein [Mycobacteriales bacterium]